MGRDAGAKDLAVVLIDMQPGFLKKFSPEAVQSLVHAQRKLLTYAAREDLLVLEFRYRGHGDTIDEVRDAISNVPRLVPFVKAHQSGFQDDLEEGNGYVENLLRQQGISRICFAGVNKSACVYSTALHAAERGFSIITSEDLVADSSSVHQGSIPGAMRWYKTHSTLRSSVEDITGPIEVPPLSREPTFLQKCAAYFQ
jgi:nicotinamidase-related amidase